MKFMPLALMAVVVLLPVERPLAEESLMDYVLTACEDDLTQYCSQVTPGEGRLLHCVAAHEDKLSGECSYALYQAASLLEELTVAIAYVANECQADIQNLCASVKAGEGRILSCLADNKSQVSDGCKQAVSDTIGD